MKDRCTLPKHAGFKNYGGRGISICKRWYDFRDFLADMGERHEGTTLDRFDSNGNYEPSNCRWATLVEQHRNTRCNKLSATDAKTIRVFLEFGVSQAKLARIYSVAASHISRINSRHVWE